MHFLLLVKKHLPLPQKARSNLDFVTHPRITCQDKHVDTDSDIVWLPEDADYVTEWFYNRNARETNIINKRLRRRMDTSFHQLKWTRKMRQQGPPSERATLQDHQFQLVECGARLGRKFLALRAQDHLQEPLGATPNILAYRLHPKLLLPAIKCPYSLLILPLFRDWWDHRSLDESNCQFKLGCELP